MSDENKLDQSLQGVLEVSVSHRCSASKMRNRWRSATQTDNFLILSTQRVIDHYRRGLSIHRMTDAEQKMINARRAKQERFLCDLHGVDANRSMVAQAHMQAA